MITIRLSFLLLVLFVGITLQQKPLCNNIAWYRLLVSPGELKINENNWARHRAEKTSNPNPWSLIYRYSKVLLMFIKRDCIETSFVGITSRVPRDLRQYYNSYRTPTNYFVRDQGNNQLQIPAASCFSDLGHGLVTHVTDSEDQEMPAVKQTDSNVDDLQNNQFLRQYSSSLPFNTLGSSLEFFSIPVSSGLSNPSSVLDMSSNTQGISNMANSGNDLSGATNMTNSVSYLASNSTQAANSNNVEHVALFTEAKADDDSKSFHTY